MAETVEIMVEGGKASAGPPIGPALGPTGVNVKQVVDEINAQTGAMAGMQVPVKIKIETDKSFSLKIGTPPTSSLLKQVLGIPKGAGEAGTEVAGDLTIAQAITVARQKALGLTGNDTRAMASEVLGVAKSMGLTCEGRDPQAVQADLKAGRLDDRFA